MMERRMAVPLAALGTMLWVMTGVGQAAPRGVAGPDRQFMMKAAQGGIAEVKLGQLASKKAAMPEVKQFGQHMVQDHTQANQELKELAASKGVKLPKDVGPEHKKAASGLMRLSGAAFDRKYMGTMVEDHVKTVALFQKEAQNGKDAETKAWAAQKLPALQEHLRMAQGLAANLAGNGDASDGGMSGHGAAGQRQGTTGR